LLFAAQVKITYEDGHEVDVKGIGRKVIDKVRETYERELAGKELAYDGEKSLFTLGSLPYNKFEFTVVLEEQRSERYHSAHARDEDITSNLDLLFDRYVYMGISKSTLSIVLSF